MYELEKTDAEKITTSLKDILLRCNLTIDDCRWQTYDGAANMAKSRNGVAQNIFSVCEQLQVASTLQKPSITAQTTVTCVNALKTNLQRQRDNFHLFYEQALTSSKAINFVENPKLSRLKQIPHRFQHEDGEQHHFQSAKDFHQAQYVEAVDPCMTALKERFDQEIYSVLMNIEAVLINASNGCAFELNDAVKRLYKAVLDFDQLKAELMLLEGIISQRLPEVKTVTSIDTIT